MRCTLLQVSCGMGSTPVLRALHAAQMVVDDINVVLRAQMPNATQLREAAESITANIQEGSGRAKGAERNLFLRYARASAEETNERLRARYAASDISAKVYWPLHNRLVTISRMLTSLMST